MLYTKIQPQSFLGSGEDFLSVFFFFFFWYMGTAAILFNGAEPFEQTDTPSTEGLMLT